MSDRLPDALAKAKIVLMVTLAKCEMGASTGEIATDIRAGLIEISRIELGAKNER